MTDLYEFQEHEAAESRRQELIERLREYEPIWVMADEEDGDDDGNE